MTRNSVLELMAQVERGEVTPAAAADRLAGMPFEDLGHTRVDHHRSLRGGLPEVIYAAGKTPAQTLAIFTSLAASGVSVLATRADEPTARTVLGKFSDAVYDPISRTVSLRQASSVPPVGHIAVVCAGTSDLPVAEEAAVTAEVFARVSFASSMSASPGCTGCWPYSPICLQPARSSSVRAWRERFPPWWVDWWACR